MGTAAADSWVGDCVVGDSAGRDFYLMDAQFTPWSGFFTWNALQYSQTGDASFLANDGQWDFDPSCLGDGDPSDCSGRLTMELDPLCVPTLQVREVHIDFDQIEDCAANGDVTLDGVVNIFEMPSVATEAAVCPHVLFFFFGFLLTVSFSLYEILKQIS